MRLIFRVSLILAVFSLSFVYGANAPKCAALQNWDDVFGVLYNDKAAVQAAVDTGITLAKIYNIPAIVTSFKEEKELGDHDVTCAGGPSTKKGVFKCVTNLDGNTKYQIGKTCYGAKPKKPTGTTVTPGDRKLTIGFNRLNSDGGRPIDRYTLETAAGEIVETSTESPFEITGLTNGQLYEYRLKAHNAIGESTHAEISGTPGAKPGKPTITTVTPGDQKLTIDFTRLDSYGGRPIDNYTLETTTGEPKSTPTESPIEITGLTNGQRYEYHLKAHNAMGASPPAVISGTPASEDPSAADPNAADPNAADPNADVKKPETTERTIILYCLLGIAIVVVVGGLACFVWKKSAAPLQIQNKDAEPNAMRDLEEGWKYSGDHHGSVVEEIELQDLKPANDSQVASDASVDVGNDARQ
eukprot:170344_1